MAQQVMQVVECDRCGWFDHVPADTKDRCPKCGKKLMITVRYCKCSECGEHVILNSNTNECEKCGELYNLFGQHLKPRSEWEEN